MNTDEKLPGRAFCLGADGFVSRLVRREMERLGTPILALSSTDLDISEPAAGSRLAQQLRPDDCLIFVAAITPDRGRDLATFMKNLRMGEQVCMALSQTACAHVTYISSDAVYADDAHPVSEACPPAPSTLHGLMHVVREQMLVHTCRERNIPLLILRPPALYGAQDTHNSYGPNRFLRLAMAGHEITLFGEGEEQRDHLYGPDLARLLARALERRSVGTLNVASGGSASFRETAQAVQELQPDTIVRGTPRQTPITHRHFDLAELRRAFPDFRPTPLREGLRETLAELTQ